MVSTAAHDPALTIHEPAPEPAPRHLHVVDAPAPGDPASGEQNESEFRSFGLAILLGIALGIPILAAMVAGAVKVMWPETDTASVLGIAVWVSLFCGPFLAGTVTVGLWADRQHQH